MYPKLDHHPGSHLRLQITLHAVRRSVDMLGATSWADPQNLLLNSTMRWDGGPRAAIIGSHQLVLHAAGMQVGGLGGMGPGNVDVWYAMVRGCLEFYHKVVGVCEYNSATNSARCGRLHHRCHTLCYVPL